METPQTFGRWLHDARRARGLSREALATHVGCAAITIRKIEGDERRPSQPFAERLFAVLEIPAAEWPPLLRLARVTSAVSPPLVPAASLDLAGLPGTTIHGYTLREQIGSGGFGAVFRAEQPMIGRDVAIKVILPQYADHPDFIRRFEAEAQIVARLEHPHIVPLYDYWRESGGAYLVMRYIRGGNLHAGVHEAPWPLDRMTRVLEQVGDALQLAHQLGVVHRDVKPANILLDLEGNAYLADFGIAKDRLAVPAPNATQTGAIVGSPDYLSPEQIRADPVTPQTDIYSLGIVLYETLTGAKAFQASTPAERIQQQLSAALPPLHERRPDLPPALNAVLQRATAKQPTDRYSNVASMVLDWQRSAAPRIYTSAWADLPTAIQGRLAAVDDRQTVTAVSVVKNPYKGLRAFDEADAADFFGRTDLVQRLLERLAEEQPDARFLAVVGPSGSGKSSVVRAGLIPALRRGGLPGSEHWFVVTVVPGARPIEEIEVALLRIAVNPPPTLLEQLQADTRGLTRAIKRSLPDDAESELLLVIDQFEEVFTLIDDEQTRTFFLDSLIAAVVEPHSRVRVIVTLRADFYDRPLHYRALGALVQARTEVVLPLGPSELEQAIVGPAARSGLLLEPGLVTTIVQEVGEQPGTLPLLQYALTELFERRQGRALTLDGYRGSGGVLGALTRRADNLYDRLDVPGQEGARQLFLRLVTIGEGAEDTRRRVQRRELTGVGTELDTIVDRYGRYRLLTFDRDPISREATVEVAHEALIRTWMRLRAWLDENRDALRMQRRLLTAVAEWTHSEGDVSFLASGARLAQFEALATQSGLVLSTDEQAYLDASIAERERQAALERERVALLQENLARSEALRLAAEANRLLVEHGNAEVTSLLAVRSLGLQYTHQGDAAITGAARLPLPALSLGGHTGAVRAVAYLPDSVHTISAGDDRTARLWDLRTGQEVRRYIGHQNDIYGLALSADGAQLATLSLDTTVRLYDVASGALRHELRGHTAPVWGGAFAPDGALLYTGGFDKTVRVWDIASGAQLRLVRETSPIQAVAVSPDGYLLAAGTQDGRVLLWNTSTWELTRTLIGHADTVWNLAFSPDGKRLLSGSLDKTARIWNVATGTSPVTLVGHTNYLGGVAFSPDGRFVLTGSQDRTARLWDATTGTQLFLFNGHTNLIWAVAYAPDGRSILTAGFDQTIKLWQLPQRPETPPFAGHASSVRYVAYTPDGKSIVSASYDGTARLWDAQSGVEQRRFGGNAGSIEGLAVAPDAWTIVTGALDGVPRLWDLVSGAELQRYEPSDDGITSIAFAPDGRSFVTGSFDYTVRVFDRESPKPRLVLRHDNNVFGVAFSPDGRSILSGAFDRTARLWDVTSGAQLKIFPVPPVSPPDSSTTGDGAASVAFAPDGHTIATGSWGGPIWLWDVASRKLLRELPGHSAFVWSVAFSADGTQLLSAGADGTARLWDVASGAELRRFTGHVGTVYSAVFAPDGRTIVTGADDGRLLTWDVSIATSMSELCARLLRDLSNIERAQYGINDDKPTCPAQPTSAVSRGPAAAGEGGR